MKRQHMRKILPLLFLSVVLCFILDAQDKKKLQTINSQINNIERKLAGLKREKKSLLNDIYEIELRYEKEKIETEKVKYQLRRTREKIQAKEFEKKSWKMKLIVQNRRLKEL